MTDIVIWSAQITEGKETWTKGFNKGIQFRSRVDLYGMKWAFFFFLKNTSLGCEDKDNQQGARQRGNRPGEAIEVYDKSKKEAASVKADGSWLRRLGALTAVSNTTSDWSSCPNTNTYAPLTRLPTASSDSAPANTRPRVTLLTEQDQGQDKSVWPFQECSTSAPAMSYS